MKKISLYVGICALGIALGCSIPDKGKNKEARKDNPTSITLEDVYIHYYDEGKPTCLYSHKGHNIGGDDSPREKEIALAFDIKLYDKDIIKNVYFGWDKYENGFFYYQNEPESKETVLSRLDNGYDKNSLENIPFKIKVEDWKGNVIEKEFTLNQILKNAKPMKTKPMQSIDGTLKCDREY